ncbi:MAG: GntR family transcriptional regulator [Actinomycetaceae bacterium]|nr:GntR family transcriptional regulator [Actinomycetaceae bacterium]
MNFSDDRPIYLQIADDIRTRILSGELAAGDRLMSTTQYASAYRINPATANKAFALLVSDGIVEKHRGIGMFVTSSARDILRAEGRASYVQTILAPALSHGLDLGLSKEEILTLISRHFESGAST